jgi:FtsP/CotA-like multicopper oxidase with cupredoxin domain
MTSYKKILGYLLVPVLWFIALYPAQVEAKVFFQCPTNGGSFSDVNGDGVIRADDGEIVNPVSPREVCMHLAAGDGFINMADKLLDPDANGMGHLQYTFGFANVTGVPDNMAMEAGMLAANFPAPTIKVKEGDELYLSLTNVGMMMRPDLFDPHTVHWHGFPNASSVFDGVPEASISINMGATLTYYYKVVEPGTFMYHCHVEATEHMQMGMLGNLYVTAAQDGTPLIYQGRTYSKFTYNDGDGSTGYDVDYPIQISSFDPNFHDEHIAVQPLPFALMDDKYPMLNGRGYPDTVNPAELANAFDGKLSQKVNALITATQGQRVLLRISSLSTTSFHTLTTQGIPMLVVGAGARKLGPVNDDTQYYRTNSVTLGGGEAVEVILDTQNVAPGTYFLYTTNLDHLANHEEDFGGMMTEIVVQ